MKFTRHIRKISLTRFTALAIVGLALATTASSRTQPTEGEKRLTPSEFDFAGGHKGGTGTSGVKGIETVVLKGDPKRPGLYTILLRVPAHTRIAAHTHPDDRVATVISGTWRIGYGQTFREDRLKALTPGSFYTEPAGDSHFAETKATPVVVEITGYGPSGTTYNDPNTDPAKHSK